MEKLAEVRRKAEEESKQVARLEEFKKKTSAELNDANSKILKLEEDLVWAKKMAARGGVPFSADEDNILRTFLESLDNPDRVLEAHDLEGGVYKEIEASRLVARSSKSIRKRVFDLRRKTKNKN